MSNYLNYPLQYINLKNINTFQGNRSYSNGYMNYPSIIQPNYVQKTTFMNGLGKNYYMTTTTNENAKLLYNLQTMYSSTRGM